MSDSMVAQRCCVSCTLEELLFQLSFCDLNLNGLVDLLRVPSSVVCIVLDCGGEECVDEGGLAESGLASDLTIVR